MKEISIGFNAYFVRAKMQPILYAHLNSDKNAKSLYQFQEGITGACIFRKSKAKGFIREAKRNGQLLEIIQARPLIEAIKKRFS